MVVLLPSSGDESCTQSIITVRTVEEEAEEEEE